MFRQIAFTGFASQSHARFRTGEFQIGSDKCIYFDESFEPFISTHFPLSIIVFRQVCPCSAYQEPPRQGQHSEYIMICRGNGICSKNNAAI